MMLTCAIVVAADQMSKHMVVSRGSFHIVNSRRGWGSRPALRGRLVVWFAFALAGVALSGVTNSTTVAVGTGAVVGGAAGNLIDASRRSGVLDFIDVRVWPVFNLADVAIVAGTILTTSTLLGW